MHVLHLLSAGLALAVLSAQGAPEGPPLYEPVGGANAPAASPPPPLVIATVTLDAGTFSVKVPSGEYTAPAGGAPNYRIPGPIVAFKGPDSKWRGHGYLETYARLQSFKSEVANSRARLTYGFEDGAEYQVTVEAKDGLVTLDEECALGPRNLYVFDAYYGWQPSGGFVVDASGERHAFLYLPCHYDKVEATVTPSTNVSPPLAAAAVFNPDPMTRDIAAFFVRTPKAWANADRMSFSIWQRRQLPGDPASRHFLGPETKSDSTPNPRTAALLGPSLYEGHVAIEFSLGIGKRAMGFAVYPKPPSREEIPAPLKALVKQASATVPN